MTKIGRQIQQACTHLRKKRYDKAFTISEEIAINDKSTPNEKDAAKYIRAYILIQRIKTKDNTIDTTTPENEAAFDRARHCIQIIDSQFDPAKLKLPEFSAQDLHILACHDGFDEETFIAIMQNRYLHEYLKKNTNFYDLTYDTAATAEKIEKVQSSKKKYRRIYTLLQITKKDDGQINTDTPQKRAAFEKARQYIQRLHSKFNPTKFYLPEISSQDFYALACYNGFDKKTYQAITKNGSLIIFLARHEHYYDLLKQAQNQGIISPHRGLPVAVEDSITLEVKNKRTARRLSSFSLIFPEENDEADKPNDDEEELSESDYETEEVNEEKSPQPKDKTFSSFFLLRGLKYFFDWLVDKLKALKARISPNSHSFWKKKTTSQQPPNIQISPPFPNSP